MNRLFYLSLCGQLELISESDYETLSEQFEGWYDHLTDREQEVLAYLTNGLESWLSGAASTNLSYQFDKALDRLEV